MRVVVKRCHFGMQCHDGSLDYNVYCDESVSCNSSVASYHLLKASIVADSDFDLAASHIYAALGDEAASKLNKFYSEYVMNGKADMILAEIGSDWTFIRVSRYGSWPILVKSSMLDYNNLLTFTDKFRAYALWDTSLQKWYSPKDELERWPEANGISRRLFGKKDG